MKKSTLLEKKLLTYFSDIPTPAHAAAKLRHILVNPPSNKKTKRIGGIFQSEIQTVFYRKGGRRQSRNSHI